jgi:hypothetical protein
MPRRCRQYHAGSNGPFEGAGHLTETRRNRPFLSGHSRKDASLKKPTEAPAISSRPGLPMFRARTVGGQCQRGTKFRWGPSIPISRGGRDRDRNMSRGEHPSQRGLKRPGPRLASHTLRQSCGQRLISRPAIALPVQHSTSLDTKQGTGLLRKLPKAVTNRNLRLNWQHIAIGRNDFNFEVKCLRHGRELKISRRRAKTWPNGNSPGFNHADLCSSRTAGERGDARF